MNSLNETMNASSIPARIPDFINGTTTSMIARVGEAPSICAASSTSLPMESMAAVQFFTTNGNARITWAITRREVVIWNGRLSNTSSNARPNTTIGNTSGSDISCSATALPRNSQRVSAYAAGTAISVAKTMVRHATIRLVVMALPRLSTSLASGETKVCQAALYHCRL